MFYNTIDINTPIGIPSGWEEIAAFYRLDIERLIKIICYYNGNTMPTNNYIDYQHDWRVEE